MEIRALFLVVHSKRRVYPNFLYMGVPREANQLKISDKIFISGAGAILACLSDLNFLSAVSAVSERYRRKL